MVMYGMFGILEIQHLIGYCSELYRERRVGYRPPTLQTNNFQFDEQGKTDTEEIGSKKFNNSNVYVIGSLGMVGELIPVRICVS